MNEPAWPSTEPGQRAVRGYRVEVTDVGGLAATVLHDERADLHATWVLGAGMVGASLVHRGEELLWQGAGVAAYARERTFMGVPFLHPWANRLDGFSYSAGGHTVTLDPASPLLKLDDNGLPIHGLLTASRDWWLSDLTAEVSGARMLASFEFDRPELLAAFPFPHRVEIALLLAEGSVRVTTTVAATGPEPVPVAFGFHPYLQLPGVPRAQWEVSFPVGRHVLLDRRQIPTGATEPAAPLHGPIGSRTWDDGFDEIKPGARFEIRAGGRAIAVEYVDGYPVAQVFAPPGQEYVCIEPMTALSNALRGSSAHLAWVPPGERHSAAFRIIPRIDD
jgi:galactose mutarotase-like enzyme